MQKLFLEIWLTYKNFEWAAEYFVPTTSRLVNEPPVQEIEKSGRIIEPAGLQVMEGFLFPNYKATKKSKLIRYLKLFQDDCAKCKKIF